MIKECKVILHNDAVVVVDFDGIEVQMTNTLKSKENTVYVKLYKNRYSLVTKDEFNNYNKKDKSKIKSKEKASKSNSGLDEVSKAIIVD